MADTVFACIAGLATVPPLTTFSQNVSLISFLCCSSAQATDPLRSLQIGVVALTRNASRQSGYVCAFFLLIMGIFAKFGAVFVVSSFSFAEVLFRRLNSVELSHWSSSQR